MIRQRCLADIDRCLDMHPVNKPIGNPDVLICAVGPEYGINAPYYGDSGGPLSYTEGGKTTVIGVTSFIGGKYLDVSVYGRVSAPDVIGWINAMKTKYEQ